MKKTVLISVLAAGCMIGSRAFAIDANQLTAVTLLPPQAIAAANTATGTAVDVAVYKGNAQFVAVADYTADATRTNVATIQHSANGTSWATLTNTAGTAMTFAITSTGTVSLGTSSTLGCDLSRASRYIRATVSRTDGGTNGAAVYMIAPMKAQ